MKILALVLILTLSIGVIPLSSYAHQSGCHRWHSCPSDSGSYVCGDLGYDTYCPKSTKSESKEKVQTKAQSTSKVSKCVLVQHYALLVNLECLSAFLVI